MFLCFVCFWREWAATVFALKRTSLGSVLECVWLKNDSEKGS